MSDNVINGTNVFVKCISSGPKNEIKSPSKAKYEERTQKMFEMDEFYRNSDAPDDPKAGQRSIRTAPDKPIQERRFIVQCLWEGT